MAKHYRTSINSQPRAGGRQRAQAHTDEARQATKEFLARVLPANPVGQEPLRAVALRPISIDDASHVIDSWCKSYRKSIVVGPVDDEVFKIEQRARIDRLICRSKTFIACDDENKEVVRGWIVFEPPRAPNVIPIVHYVCVHPGYQRRGIGTALIELARRTAGEHAGFMWCTHETHPMRHIRPKWSLLFNPYLLEVSDQLMARRATGYAQGALDHVFHRPNSPTVLP